MLYKNEEVGIEEDEKIISYLVFNCVVAGKKDGFREKCTQKIITTIKSIEWQKTYRSTHFVHIFDLYTREEVGDIKFMLMCQLLEILYFYKCNDKPAKELTRISFDVKLKDLFESIYSKKINTKTSNVLRILRNHVAHTGTLKIIRGVIKSGDINAVNGFKKKFKTNSLRPLAFSFNYLMEDIFFRVVGLDDNELLVNGNPPQYLNFYKGI